MTSHWRTLLFDLGAAPYAFYTAQDVWRHSCATLVRYFPAPAALPEGGEPVVRVVDLGCGPGVTALAMARCCAAAHITGVDVAAGMLRQAARARHRAEPDVAGRVRFLQTDAARLPFDEGSVDAVTGHSFLYLLPNRPAVLAEARRILRPGGRAIFMEPHAKYSSPAALLRYSHDPRFVLSVALWRCFSRAHVRYTGPKLLAELDRAGLRPLASHDVLGGMGVVGAAER
jgi:ubiquinone/menaquinone biosynthesis C-methylase UbiE